VAPDWLDRISLRKQVLWCVALGLITGLTELRGHSVLRAVATAVVVAGVLAALVRVSAWMRRRWPRSTALARPWPVRLSLGVPIAIFWGLVQLLFNTVEGRSLNLVVLVIVSAAFGLVIGLIGVASPAIEQRRQARKDRAT
jgi:hypothetical protein